MTAPTPILFFLCLNDRGGAELSMIKLAQGLLDKGRAVTLAVYGANPALAHALGFAGPVIDLGATRTAAAFWPLYRLLRRGRFSHLISALTHTNIVAGFAVSLARLNVQLIVTEHGLDGAEACRASAAFRILTRLSYSSATKVVAVSQGLAEQWQSILPIASVMTIYNPVVPDTAPAVRAAAHPWLDHATIPVIMGIGRLKEEKNFQLLIRAFALLTTHKSARLIILGEGEQRAMLETLAKELGVQDKILMPGFVAATDAWLPYAKVLACPSRREGLGNVLIEAMALGVSVISTDCPYGPSEILVKGQYGKLVQMDDIEALARAILDAIDAKPDAQKLRLRAADFTVSRCIDAYLRLVDNASSS